MVRGGWSKVELAADGALPLLLLRLVDDAGEEAIGSSVRELGGRRRDGSVRLEGVEGGAAELEAARFSLEVARFSLEGARFSLEGARFSLEGARFSLEGARFSLEGARFSLESARFSLKCARFSLVVRLLVQLVEALVVRGHVLEEERIVKNVAHR